MTVTARGRSGGGAGMEEKCDAPGLGFLGLDRMRVLLPPLRLPEKLSASRTLRTHLFTNYRMRKVRDSSRWLIPLWVSIWVFIASLIYLRMSHQAVEKRRESLAIMCDDRARMLQDQLNVSMNHLQALAILVSTFHHSKTPSAIDQVGGTSIQIQARFLRHRTWRNHPFLSLLQKTFAWYAERTAFERPLTSGVAYGVKVTHAEREQFERQQGWSIKKMYSSKTKKQSQGPGNAEDAEVREPAEEYAPVIFAQDAYKHVISFDLLSGAVSIRSPLPSPRKIFFTEQAHGRKKNCNLWCSPCAHQSSSVATPFSPRILPFLFNPGLSYSL
jgi:histidine kinase 2/3/4 (cytokinin receptor)